MTKQFTLTLERLFELIVTALDEMIPAEYYTREILENYTIQVFGMLRYMQRVPNLTREMYLDKIIKDTKDVMLCTKDIPDFDCFKGLDLDECVRLIDNQPQILRRNMKKLDDEMYKLLGCDDFDGYKVLFNQGMVKLRAAANASLNVEDGEALELVVNYSWCDDEEYQFTISWGSLGNYTIY